MKKANIILLLSLLALGSCSGGQNSSQATSQGDSSTQQSSRATSMVPSSIPTPAGTSVTPPASSVAPEVSSAEPSVAPASSMTPEVSSEEKISSEEPVVESSEEPSVAPASSVTPAATSEEESTLPPEVSSEQSPSSKETSEDSSALPSSAQSSEEEGVIVLDNPEIVDADYKGVTTTDACYEIFVYSFCDSNGDGVGDLKGIESKLDYLHELGVRNLWLTPIHPSSTYHKYNVRNYYDIDSEFGTIDDFVSLCNKAKQKGIGIFMDMVFNHSGLDNPLFERAIADYLNKNAAEDSLADLYTLSTDAKEVPNTKSSYNNRGTTIWYECNFDRSMPEFNTQGKSAPKLHEDVMRFWINKGASGFRFDGVAYYDYASAKLSMAYVKTLSTAARAIKPDVYLIAEYWKSSQSYINEVPKNGMGCFNFTTSDTVANSVLNGVRGGRGQKFAKTLASADAGFREASDATILPSVFISNHDQDRWAKNLNDLQFKQVVATYLLTPGTPYLYYGEEIGMLGTRAAAATDANRRLPMQWTTPVEGDSERPTSILRDSDYTGKQTELGALEAISDPDSITHWYKEVLSFRLAHPEIARGSYQCLISDKTSPICAFRIRYEGKSYYLVHNFNKAETFKIALPEECKVVSGFQIGEASLTGAKLTLGASSSILLSEA